MTAVSTRDRIVFASAELFRRQGYTATGMKQVVTEAKAPFGSLYHFFPGGKEQLADEVLRRAGAFFLLLFESVADPAPDPETATADFFAGAAETLEATDFQDACPIAAVALEVASTNDTLRQATADVFESWIGAAASRFEQAGLDEDAARAQALSMLSSLEGAFVLCRALRSTEPMHAAGATAVASVRTAIQSANSGRRSSSRS